MKRNQHLVSLSQEHHHGLVFANRLKRGVDKGIPVGLLRDYTLGFWDEFLEPHFISEEKYLLPLLPQSHGFVQRVTHEHTIIRELVRRARETSVDIDNFKKLVMTLNEHIRFEERQLFPFAEDILTQKQLETAGTALNLTEVGCYNFTPEFWRA